MSETIVKSAIIQKAPQFLNLDKSVKLAQKYIIEAANNGANLIVFPESWLPGYPVWLDFAPNAALWDYRPANELFRILAENSLKIPGEHFNKFINQAKELSVNIVLGTNEIEGKTIYNTMIFIDEKGNYKIHRKLVPTYSERLIWGRGDGSTINIMDTSFGKLGGLICWEHWMPLLRSAMHSIGETIHIAQWPTVKEMNIISSRHYAFEAQCFVIAAGTVLSKDEMVNGLDSLKYSNLSAIELLKEIPVENKELIMKGGSCVIQPNGNFVQKPVYEKSEIIYSEIDISKILEGGIVMDSDGHYSRPDIFTLEVNTQNQKNVIFKKNNLENE